MSMIIAKQIDENGYVDARALKNYYPKLCDNGTKLWIFVNRIFNDKKKIIDTPKIALEAQIVIDRYDCKLDLSQVMKKHGVARYYYVEVIATNFIKDGDLIPVFPNEIIPDCDYGIQEVVNKEIEIIQKAVEIYEVIGRLHHAGLVEISDDLREAVTRLEEGDVDGSIKFFRKVIEGFEHWVNEDVLKSSNRVDAVKDYLKKSFHLLSNFGEHHGTGALMNEALFSKELTISTAKYLMSKKEK